MSEPAPSEDAPKRPAPLWMAIVFPLLFVVVGGAAMNSGLQARAVRAQVEALVALNVEVEATGQDWVSEGSPTCFSRCSRYTFTLDGARHACVSERVRDDGRPTLYVKPDDPTLCTAGLRPAFPFLMEWGIPGLGLFMACVGLLLSLSAAASGLRRAG